MSRVIDELNQWESYRDRLLRTISRGEHNPQTFEDLRQSAQEIAFRKAQLQPSQGWMQKVLGGVQ